MHLFNAYEDGEVNKLLINTLIFPEVYIAVYSCIFNLFFSLNKTGLKGCLCNVGTVFSFRRKKKERWKIHGHIQNFGGNSDLPLCFP